MMPPAALAELVDRAEAIVVAGGGRLMRFEPLERRRLLAEAVLAVLRGGHGPADFEPAAVA